MAFDDRLRDELQRAIRPIEPANAFERVAKRKARRGTLRRIETMSLAITVIAGTLAGSVALNRVFRPSEGGGGQIAFVRLLRPCYAHPNVSGGLNLFSVDVLTGDERLISSESSFPDGSLRSEQWPSFSPDGTRYAWVDKYRDNLYVTDVLTEETEQLTHDLDVGPPRFSPDGSTILFSAPGEPRPIPDAPPGYSEVTSYVYTVNADGSNLRRLEEGAVPTWTSEGRIALLRTHFHVETQRQSDATLVTEVPEPTEFFLMDADGTGIEKVYEAPGDVQIVDASWSPDGVHVAAQVTIHGNSDIYVLDTENRTVTRITSDRDEDRSPTWSPDGSRIAYSGRVNGNREIVMVNADGTGRTPLTTDDCWEDTEPTWIPNDAAVSVLPTWTPPPLPDLGEPGLPSPNQILFLDSVDNVYDLYSADPDGSGRVNLTADIAEDSTPDWSPDRTQIVFASNGDDFSNWDIYVLDATSGDVNRLTTDPTDEWNPAWSADGSRIAFIRDSALWVMDADGTDAREVVGAGPGIWAGDPSWSPDGSRIAFTRTFKLWIVDADGSNIHRLSPGDPVEVADYEPEWSPDGRSILFTRNQDLYTMQPDGSNVRLLTDGDGETYDRSGTWSPDGTQILFSSDRGPGDDYRLFVMNADGTDVRLVGDLTGGEPDW